LFQIVGSFLTFHISQGSVATRFRCGGYLMTVSLHVYCWVWQWKNFENR